MRMYDGRLPSEVKVGLSVVLSGPRCPSGDPRRNTNPGRLLPALRDTADRGGQLLISGHGRESAQLREEYEALRRQYRLPLTESQVFICDRAEHTTGNAVYTLDRVRREFFDFSTRELHLAVYTDAWHMPRAAQNFHGVQLVLRAKNRSWRRTDPIQFHFVRVASGDDLDPDFLRPYLEHEARKLKEDGDRRDRWLRGELKDAPAYVLEALQDSVDSTADIMQRVMTTTS